MSSSRLAITLSPFALAAVAFVLPGPGSSGAGPGFTRTTLPVSGSPRRVDAADLDDDGDVDLVLETISGTQSLQLVLRNDGGQVFAPGWSATLFSEGYPGVTDLDLGDVDGDGHPDLVFQIPSHNTKLRLNNGDGTFAEPTLLPVPNIPCQQSLGDLDDDGDVDLAYYLLDFLGYAGALRNDGQGGFDYAGEVPLGSITAPLQSTALGDASGDGAPDFVLPDSHGLFMLRGMSAPVLAWALPPQLLAPGPHRDAAFADLDGNGWEDLVATRHAGGVSVVLVDAGGPSAPHTYPAAQGLPFGSIPGALALADVDGDGHVDAATTRAGSVSVLGGDGAGVLESVYQARVGRALVDLAAADLDGDGDTDLAAADAGGNSVVLLFNRRVP